MNPCKMRLGGVRVLLKNRMFVCISKALLFYPAAGILINRHTRQICLDRIFPFIAGITAHRSIYIYPGWCYIAFIAYFPVFAAGKKY